MAEKTGRCVRTGLERSCFMVFCLHPSSRHARSSPASTSGGEASESEQGERAWCRAEKDVLVEDEIGSRSCVESDFTSKIQRGGSIPNELSDHRGVAADPARPPANAETPCSFGGLPLNQPAPTGIVPPRPLVSPKMGRDSCRWSQPLCQRRTRWSRSCRCWNQRNRECRGRHWESMCRLRQSGRRCE